MCRFDFCGGLRYLWSSGRAGELGVFLEGPFGEAWGLVWSGAWDSGWCAGAWCDWRACLPFFCDHWVLRWFVSLFGSGTCEITLLFFLHEASTLLDSYARRDEVRRLTKNDAAHATANFVFFVWRGAGAFRGGAADLECAWQNDRCKNETAPGRKL